MVAIWRATVDEMGTIVSPSRYEATSGLANKHAELAAACRKHYATETPNSGGGSFGRAGGRRLLRRWQQQVGRHAEAGAQSLHHRHAQPLLAAKNFTDAARGAQDRHHVGSREAMLVHQVTDHIREARRPAGPFALLISRNQARLRLQPHNIGWIIRTPKPINERTSSRELGIAVDQDHGCIHYTVSASISSYSACVPKNRIIKTLA